MSEDRWIKFKINMYEDIKLKILDEMDDRDLHHYIWARSIVLAGKLNRSGYLYITDTMPYTIKTLAIEFNRTVEEVRKSYKILKKLEMIEFTEDKVFKIKNWEKHQNVEGMERSRLLNNERVAKCRAKKKEMMENSENKSNSIQEIADENEEKINNLDNQVEEKAFKSSEDAPKENVNSIIENNDDSKVSNKCNVTGNANNLNCNVTVMEQIKREKEIKNKNEKKIESKSDFKITSKDLNQSEGDALSKTKNLSDAFAHVGSEKNIEEENANNQEAAKLLKYYENITGILGGLNIGFLKIAIDMHGYKNVKMAINKALEVNKANMTYINGILKNWRREGYPKEDKEVKTDVFRNTGKSNTEDKNEFAGFKPKEPRKLTEEERKKAIADFI